MFTTEKQGYEEGGELVLQMQEEARTDRLSVPVWQDVLLESSVLRSAWVQVRLQGGRTGNDREGESGGEAGEDSQSLIDGICLFGWEMGLMLHAWLH